jgi:hypothetical protein
MVLRRWIIVALAAVSATGCGESGPESTAADPHPPRSEDERFVAARYGEFVRALERKNAEGICRYLEPRLAESYGCGEGPRLRIPHELRRIEVPMTGVFAVRDPSVPDEIQISSPTTRKDGLSLIVFFRRNDSNEWRIKQTMVGGYG